MKDILIYSRDFRERTSAQHFGVRLAASLRATATSVYVYPVPVYYALEMANIIAENARKRGFDALQARQPFLDWATSLGVPRADWLVAGGDASQALAQAAARYDVLVLDHAPAGTDSTWDIPDLILKADVPCIVTPHHAAHYTGIERIAVGWNGSPEAMRALHAALPLMRGKEVLLMSGELRDTTRGVVWKTPFDVAQYLQHHDIKVTESAITAAPTDVGGALLEHAMRFHADLLVMGAYGRSRFSEWMLGGATRYVLARAEMPLLLRH